MYELAQSRSRRRLTISDAIGQCARPFRDPDILRKPSRSGRLPFYGVYGQDERTANKKKKKIDRNVESTASGRPAARESISPFVGGAFTLPAAGPHDGPFSASVVGCGICAPESSRDNVAEAHDCL